MYLLPLYTVLLNFLVTRIILTHNLCLHLVSVFITSFTLSLSHHYQATILLDLFVPM